MEESFLLNKICLVIFIISILTMALSVRRYTVYDSIIRLLKDLDEGGYKRLNYSNSEGKDLKFLEKLVPNRVFMVSFYAAFISMFGLIEIFSTLQYLCILLAAIAVVYLMQRVPIPSNSSLSVRFEKLIKDHYPQYFTLIHSHVPYLDIEMPWVRRGGSDRIALLLLCARSIKWKRDINAIWKTWEREEMLIFDQLPTQLYKEILERRKSIMNYLTPAVKCRMSIECNTGESKDCAIVVNRSDEIDYSTVIWEYLRWYGLCYNLKWKIEKKELMTEFSVSKRYIEVIVRINEFRYDKFIQYLENIYFDVTPHFRKYKNN